MLLKHSAVIFGLAISASVTHAHEVWIEPEVWQYSVGATMTAQLRNGQNFEGTDLFWNPNTIVRAEKWSGTERELLAGRLGDKPALTTQSQKEGLLTLLYQSTPNSVVYREYEKFFAFVMEKGHEQIVSEHNNRKLSKTVIREAYTRYAKSLIAVGAGQGADVGRDLEIEIIALNNPYAADPKEQMQFEVRYQNTVLPANRVTLFAKKPDGSVATSHQETNKDGIVTFQLAAGTTYLLDTVIIRQPSRKLAAQTGGAVWESLWASLTFQIPYGQ